ncbi:MAG: chemotaxis-specific protein-glutamate methyltransferase CheB, partial [bacterium]|nr:chemotaxis-specific protein-glutamate methyltransferase CheB [bacterium]
KAIRLKPDVITMDINMPVMDGIAALKDIVKMKIAPVIMLSAFSAEEAQATLEAMEVGAFDFIPKPHEIDTMDTQSSAITQKLKQAAASNIYGKINHRQPPVTEPWTTTVVKTPLKPPPSLIPPLEQPGFKAVAIGLSTGGPKAIFKVLPHLPADLDAAIIVVQHMPPAFISTFTQRLNKKTALECVESEPGMKLEPKKIYVAKGGFHLKLIRRSNRDIVIRQTKDPPHLFLPSVDITMHSVCNIFGAKTIGVLMTGMGRDGADGLARIRQSGGKTIAESEETAIVFGMPREAIKKGAAQQVVPNWAIAEKIVKAVNRCTNNRN